MQKKMMILGASALQVPAIRKAKELGYQIILVDYDENAVGFQLADVKLVVSTLDQEEVYRQALHYCPDVVITSTSDGPVRTAAYVNERLGKQPDLSYEDSLCATIKSYMRERLKENNVPIPDFYSVRNFEEFMNAVRKLKNCCIVKPADNAGSRGVVSLDETEKRTEEELRQTYEYSKGNSRNGIVMVEEFMKGPEVSVEAMTVNGETTIITITDKYITQPPYFVEIAHSEPSRLSMETQEQIKQVALQAISAIRLQNGPSHTEIKVTEDGPKIVELAARLGGDFITSRLVPLSTGIDMVGASVLLATGEEVNLEQKWQKGAAIHFIQGREGIIKSIGIDEEIHTLQGVEEVVIDKKAGDAVNGTKSSNDRLGHIITVCGSAEEAMEIGSKALEFVHVEYE
ncbi:MAG: ATP-grasp domain-containing protein [Lachnospiraceae bacterium]|nr:ATP-grasp domain-containing protein [Lachnospiraceae bacterium]